MVFDRSPLKQVSPKTNSSRTIPPIDHNDIAVIRPNLRNQAEISHRRPSHLRVFMKGDGTSNDHYQVMYEKGLDYAMTIRNSTLQRGACSMAYGAYYLPSLAYGTPATNLSYKECEDVQRAVIAAILPKMGIIRNVARKFGGLGLDHMATIQNYPLLQYLIGHIRSKSITSKLIHQQLHYTQLDVGCSGQVLGQYFTRYSQAILCPNWIKAIWESLHACKATFAISSEWSPQSARIGDITIME
jgi:hypothetical protein